MAVDFDYEKTRTYDTDGNYDDESEFRSHYESAFADSEQRYEAYAPAYRYGYDLATDVRYAGNEWPVIEETARVDWMESDGDDYDWDTLREVVRFGWERGQAKTRARNEESR